MSSIMSLFSVASMVWSFALFVAICAELAWQIRDADALERIWRGMARVHQELWIVAPIGIAYWAVRDWHGSSPWQVFFDGLSLFNWWWYRNWPGDNHWKRRAKKAKEAVAVRAGRLVVVPIGASS